MPSEAQIVNLYDGQIDVKFYSKGHKYFVRANKEVVTYLDYPNEDEVETEFSKVGEWIKTKSVTSYTGKALDKPQLHNWISDTAVAAFKEAIQNGENLEKAEGIAKSARWKVFNKAGKHGSAIHDYVHKYVLYKMGKGPKLDVAALKQEDREVIKATKGLIQWLNKNVKEYVDTEHIVYHPLFKVSGTLDLTFVDNQDNFCIIDIKTSSGVWPKDVMQLAFYRKTYGLQHLNFPDKAFILHADKKTGKITPMYNLDHASNFVAFECAKFLVAWEETLKLDV